jgi:23S rRNA (uracil1939-C5)-methyltransferase
MVILVSTTNTLPNKDEIIKKLTSRYNNISSVVLNVNKLATPNVLTNESIVLYGDNYLEEELCGLKFKIGVTSFFQVNNEQTEKLYNKVLELGYIKNDDSVIDAYCGIGTISLMLAKRAKHVYGVEVVEEAIKNALDNAKLNNIKNVTFEAGLAEEVVKKWKDKANVLVVDPPRKGIDEALVNTILESNFEKIVYVSCNPTTLARDVRMLSDKYKVKTIQPVDMFPHTHHVETVVLLYRK